MHFLWCNSIILFQHGILSYFSTNLQITHQEEKWFYKPLALISHQSLVIGDLLRYIELVWSFKNNTLIADNIIQAYPKMSFS